MDLTEGGEAAREQVAVGQGVLWVPMTIKNASWFLCCFGFGLFGSFMTLQV